MSTEYLTHEQMLQSARGIVSELEDAKAQAELDGVRDHRFSAKAADWEKMRETLAEWRATLAATDQVDLNPAVFAHQITEMLEALFDETLELEKTANNSRALIGNNRDRVRELEIRGVEERNKLHDLFKTQVARGGKVVEEVGRHVEILEQRYDALSVRIEACEQLKGRVTDLEQVSDAHYIALSAHHTVLGVAAKALVMAIHNIMSPRNLELYNMAKPLAELEAILEKGKPR